MAMNGSEQHTITISDDIWEWARKRCRKQEGPATYLRNIIVREIVRGNDNKSPSVEGSNGELWDTNIPDIRPLCQNLTNTTKLAIAIKESSWDRIDPKGRMRMPPDEVDDFLLGQVFRPHDYTTMPDGMRSLLDLIIDAYGRWWRLHAEART